MSKSVSQPNKKCDIVNMKYSYLLLYMNSFPNLDTHLLRPIVLLYDKSYCNLIPVSLEWSHSQCRNRNIWKKTSITEIE